MPLSEKDRQIIINDLTTNCDCWKAKGDKEILNGFDDNKLLSLKANNAKGQLASKIVANATKGYSDGKNALRINPDNGLWEHRTLVDNTPANQDPEPVEEQVEEPVVNETPVEETPVANENEGWAVLPGQNTPATKSTKPVAGQRKPVANATKSAPPARPAQQKALTVQDWMKAHNAPPELFMVVNAGLRAAEEKKQALITRLLVNVAEEEREAVYNQLSQYAPEHLELMAKLQPQTVYNYDAGGLPQMPVVNAGGFPASGGVDFNTPIDNSGDDDLLELPRMQWGSARKGKAAAQ